MEKVIEYVPATQARPKRGARFRLIVLLAVLAVACFGYAEHLEAWNGSLPLNGYPFHRLNAGEAGFFWFMLTAFFSFTAASVAALGWLFTGRLW